MQILQKPSFQRAYKKLKPNQKKAVDDAMDVVINDPFAGEPKKGDLSGLFVYKFRMLNQLTLLAYTYDDFVLVLTFIMVGVHENFYRDLKR